MSKCTTVSPRIACKFVPKNHRAIRNRAVWDYYLLVSDPNEFKNHAIVRNFTIKSHYLRNFSEEYIFLLWKSHYCEEFTLFEYLFCFSNRAISRNSHYLNIFGPKIKSRYSEFALFESALFEDLLYIVFKWIYSKSSNSVVFE